MSVCKVSHLSGVKSMMGAGNESLEGLERLMHGAVMKLSE